MRATPSQAPPPPTGAEHAGEHSLYPLLLGTAFDALPEPLRGFHLRGGIATGRFEVRRGRGRIARAIADRMGLPDEARAARVVLEVLIDPAGQRWSRSFDGRGFASFQRAESELLLESLGRAVVGFRLDAADGVLTYRTARVRALGVNWPRWLRPTVSADVRATSSGWRVDVSVTAPVLGLLCAYGGEMEPA